MEYEMICDECKRKYHIVLKENEKIAKNATEERIDFEETKLEENNVLSKCPCEIRISALNDVVITKCAYYERKD